MHQKVQLFYYISRLNLNSIEKNDDDHMRKEIGNFGSKMLNETNKIWQKSFGYATYNANKIYRLI